MNKKSVKVYTDGACSGNPGPGGWGAILIYGGKRKELSGGFRRTTNNRMELMGAIEALRALKEPCDVALYSDSKYVVDAIDQGWAEKWRANGWRRGKKGEKAVNPDLWQELLEEIERHSVSFHWVKGHHTNPENNRCDELAVEASRGSNLPVDEAYEAASSSDE